MATHFASVKAADPLSPTSPASTATGLNSSYTAALDDLVGRTDHEAWGLLTICTYPEASLDVTVNITRSKPIPISHKASDLTVFHYPPTLYVIHQSIFGVVKRHASDQSKRQGVQRARGVPSLGAHHNRGQRPYARTLTSETCSNLVTRSFESK
ncbi:hypothetical protein BV22DRAFT_1044308 [Leucogyrophana mollusca]|uniref:Uncharacterized protein n=1 Tax=Leucogyrophana mollusca TaxID=85980 RepID=A0ACB8BTH7_9AGAM|nr:hypothetical protein BV22DRAFT_1044308 [Leucogyrophana mollusca]